MEFTTLRHRPGDRSHLCCAVLETDPSYGVKHLFLLISQPLRSADAGAPHSYRRLITHLLVRLHAPQIIAGAVPGQQPPVSITLKSEAQILYKCMSKWVLVRVEFPNGQPCQTIVGRTLPSVDISTKYKIPCMETSSAQYRSTLAPLEKFPNAELPQR